MRELIFNKRSVSSHIEKITGVKKDKEILRVSEISLPETIHRYAIEAVKATDGSFCEKWALFAISDEGVKVLKEGTGEEVDLEGGFASAEIDRTSIDELTQPVDVVFHAHPAFTAEYFRSRGATGLTGPDGEEISLEDHAVSCRFLARHFSGGDAENMESHRPRSALLASHYGFKMVLNPQLFDFKTIFNTGKAALYDKQLEELAKALRDKVRQGEINQADVEHRISSDDEADRLLANFCAQKGFVAFSNYDLTSSRLRRVSE